MVSREVQVLQLYCPGEGHLPSFSVLRLSPLDLCTFIKQLVSLLPSFSSPLFLCVHGHLSMGADVCEGVRVYMFK